MRCPTRHSWPALAKELGVSIRDLLIAVPLDWRDLGRLRLEAGLTIGELAVRVGIAGPTWARWERGFVKGPAERVPGDNVASVLGVDQRALQSVIDVTAAL